MDEKWGEWAFLVGVGISVIIGLAAPALGGYIAIIYGILALLGLVVGLMNVGEKETTAFLVAAIALLTTGAPFSRLEALPALGMVIPFITGIVSALGVFVAPAAVVVALKAIYNLASKK
ncbi:MAG: hypothetical protein AABX38_00920 [Candidatus Micrarchaeota archaeon]